MLEDIIALLGKGGLVLIPIFIVAQVGWLLAIAKLWDLRMMSFSQARFWKRAPSGREAFLDFARVEHRRIPGLFGRLLARMIESAGQGEKGMANAAREELHDQVGNMQKNLSTIAVMAGSAPLLGLLGTVTGMVSTFKIITQFGIGNPAMMAEGLAEALLTTQAGLSVGFPLVLMHNYLLNRADAIETECIQGATRLIKGLR